MSKRKGSTISRQSKRHKGNDYYNDGRSQLEREMALLEEHERDQERQEFESAQEKVQGTYNQHHINQNQTSGIVAGDTSDEDADEDRLSSLDGDEDYQQGIISSKPSSKITMSARIKNTKPNHKNTKINVNRISTKEYDS